jgi:hypothetical protein
MIMLVNIVILTAVLALAIGIWIGLGAPGWPHDPPAGRRHRNTRPLNPIQGGRPSASGSSQRRR